jgi:ATP-dependent Clp protease ATP-binding subunit ClpC
MIIPGQIPLTPLATKVLVDAQRESASLGHNYVGTEHILLALGRAQAGVAAAILKELDLALPVERIREQVISIVGIGE